MKKCRSCGTEKYISEFPIDKRKHDGVHTECKSCLAARARARRRGIICTKDRWDNQFTCVECNTTKPLNRDNFFPVKSRLTKFDVMCRDCRNAYHRKIRQEKKTPEIKEKIRKEARKKHQELKIQCIEYLGGKCEHCSTAYDGTNGMIFDFHHRDPKQKEFQILKQRKHTWSHTKKELDKCQLLCANCHRKMHSQQY